MGTSARTHDTHEKRDSIMVLTIFEILVAIWLLSLLPKVRKNNWGD
jgi:hypothetical protein